jgi:predicted phage tail component-like protein
MIIYNGVDLSNRIDVTKIGGRGPLSQNVIRTSIPGMEGSYYQRRKLPERPIPVSFEMVGNSLEEVRQNVDDLNATLNSEIEVPIEFLDEPGKTYFGSLDGQPDWDELYFIGKGTINLLCCDPLKYGAEVFETFANDEATPNVDGTYKTFPRIEATFTAAASYFKVTHTQQNKHVRVNRDFVAGDVLEVDFRTGKIMLNGIVTMPLLAWETSDFFTLTPGAQTLNVEPSAVADTKIYWKPRWL